jgi:hypothetical protein
MTRLNINESLGKTSQFAWCGVQRMTEISLCRTWERAAARELVDVLYVLMQGAFTQPDELAAKLKDLILYLETEFSSPGVEDEAKVLFDDIMDSILGGKHE